ncbi:MAG TPA: type II toxin-antitoxin system HicB family antitoxin [Candidatus Paceibacterota bacterium]
MLNDRKYTIETEQEIDGRWIAEIIELPGVMAYGETIEQAQAKVEALAFRVLAEEIDASDESKPIGFSRIAFSNV